MVAPTILPTGTSVSEKIGRHATVAAPAIAATTTTISIDERNLPSHTVRRPIGSACNSSSRPALSSPAVSPDTTVIAIAENSSGTRSAYSWPST